MCRSGQIEAVPDQRRQGSRNRFDRLQRNISGLEWSRNCAIRRMKCGLVNAQLDCDIRDMTRQN
jgi:hypothetical protein